MLRVKNEEQWIEQVLKSILPICSRVYVFDDHSTDNTALICKSLFNVHVVDSPFKGLDEARDKNYLLKIARKSVTPVETRPDWFLWIDGDEELTNRSIPIIQKEVKNPKIACYSLRIWYLWDQVDQIRVDGVYGRFHRPSLFRNIEGDLAFRSTKSGGNLHCSSIPIEIIRKGSIHVTEAALIHYGYLLRNQRVEKYKWYNEVDPGNISEDYYRHMIQGDIPEVPRSMKLRHAGPLRLQTVNIKDFYG
jgi:glycosyltransferase involved in cell wall biosynthesis